MNLRFHLLLATVSLSSAFQNSANRELIGLIKTDKQGLKGKAPPKGSKNIASASKKIRTSKPTPKTSKKIVHRPPKKKLDTATADHGLFDTFSIFEGTLKTDGDISKFPQNMVERAIEKKAKEEMQKAFAPQRELVESIERELEAQIKKVPVVGGVYSTITLAQEAHSIYGKDGDLAKLPQRMAQKVIADKVEEDKKKMQAVFNQQLEQSKADLEVQLKSAPEQVLRGLKEVMENEEIKALTKAAPVLAYAAITNLLNSHEVKAAQQNTAQLVKNTLESQELKAFQEEASKVVMQTATDVQQEASKAMVRTATDVQKKSLEAINEGQKAFQEKRKNPAKPLILKKKIPTKAPILEKQKPAVVSLYQKSKVILRTSPRVNLIALNGFFYTFDKVTQVLARELVHNFKSALGHFSLLTLITLKRSSQATFVALNAAVYKFDKMMQTLARALFCKAKASLTLNTRQFFPTMLMALKKAFRAIISSMAFAVNYVRANMKSFLYHSFMISWILVCKALARMKHAKKEKAS